MNEIKIHKPFFIVILLFVIGLIFTQYNSSGSSVITKKPLYHFAKNQALEMIENKESFYLLYINKKDPTTEDFLSKVKHWAKQNNIKVIYASDVTSMGLSTSLNSYRSGELNRAISSDESDENLRAFFNGEKLKPKESDYEPIEFKGRTIVIKDILLTHLIQQYPDLDNLNKNEYAIAFKFYFYNNNKEIEDIGEFNLNLIPKYFEIQDDNNNVINSYNSSHSFNRIEVLKGEIVNGIYGVTFREPVDPSHLTLNFKNNEEFIKLSDLEKVDMVDLLKLDF